MLLFCLLCHNATLHKYRLPSVTAIVTKPSAERTSQNSVKPKFAEFTYQGDKRCTIAFLKMVADFSRGRAHPAMQPPISATHPHPAIRVSKLREALWTASENTSVVSMPLHRSVNRALQHLKESTRSTYYVDASPSATQVVASNAIWLFRGSGPSSSNFLGPSVTMV
jgi:hypothetical protein